MASGPKLVHKQFNSPIGLYSQHNIQETLNKHLQNLDNGTVGIDFNDPATGKPGNLANSAVLRMLEEEERSRKGYPSQKKVVWPPVPETNGYHQTQNQQPQAQAYYNNAQLSPSAQQYQQPSPQQQQQAPSPQYKAPSPQYQAPSPQYKARSPQFQAQSPQYQSQAPQFQAQPPQAAYCEGRRQENTAVTRLIPITVGVNAPGPFRQGPASPLLSPQARADLAQPFRPQQSRWAPVPSPQSPQPTSAYGPPSYSPQETYAPPQRQFEPPPSTVTLRPSPPVHQRPPPVYASQPAAASFQGGVNMRGDQKWPPQTVREAVEAENEARRQLAKGPACRPRKVARDYRPFFAKNQLNQNYPGYRVPPGTQHYEDHSGQSAF